MKNQFAKLFLPFMCVVAVSCSEGRMIDYDRTYDIPYEVMMDKIKGGWYGQTIACTYGGPTEFKYNGALMDDRVPVPWNDSSIFVAFTRNPGLYDDVYMDLTFLEVMSAKGLDAPLKDYADAFAVAPFSLWHANQAARYNILNGTGAPDSGFWKNNPHADDIDFQIESDFIGMVNPGMPVTAAGMADGIGHIMNYGDGWYGGVFMAAMYSLAFVCDDIPTVVREALEVIPEGTQFRDCISALIDSWERNPDDWKQCWFDIQNAFGYDVGCPEGVWNSFDIDATINAAHVVTGLLYGNGDFGRTVDIATRCGDDSDCNPASAAGILGVMYGYSYIPESWKGGIDRISDMPFPYTSLTLDSACERNYELMCENLKRNGGEISDGHLCFRLQKPEPVRVEKCFENLSVSDRYGLNITFSDMADVEFDGDSFVINGSVSKNPGFSGNAVSARRQSDFLNAWIASHDSGFTKEERFADDNVAVIRTSIDGSVVSEFPMPTDFRKRRYEVFSAYGLGNGHHSVHFEIINPSPEFSVRLNDIVLYKYTNN